MTFLDSEITTRQAEVRRLINTLAERVQMNADARKRYPAEAFAGVAQLFGGDGFPGYDLDKIEDIETVATMLDAAYRATIELKHAKRMLVARSPEFHEGLRAMAAHMA